MFNDRDIAVIGVGAFASVLCLLLPVPFPWKVGLGFTTLVIFMFVALIRLGRDRLTLEEYLIRRVRYWLRPRLWTFHMRDLPRRPAPREKPIPHPAEAPAGPRPPRTHGSGAVSWNVDPVKVERLASLLMIVVGLYFLDWLRLGGAVTLGMDLAWLLP